MGAFTLPHQSVAAFTLPQPEDLASVIRCRAPVVTRPEPVTQLNVRPDGTPDSTSPLTEQADMLEGATNYYKRQLNAPFTPTPAALRDRERVLAGVRAAMMCRLPRSVARGLDIEAIIHPENIIAAVKSLHRESTPGVE